VEAVRSREESPQEKEAWWLLNRAVVNYCGSAVGTVAANDPSTANHMLNYDQVFIRDFVPSAIAFLLRGESDIVKNFLLHTLQLQVSHIALPQLYPSSLYAKHVQLKCGSGNVVVCLWNFNAISVGWQMEYIICSVSQFSRSHIGFSR
jgi:hypothetical protein